MLSEADILEALRACYDPQLACNIVDLGMVNGVAIAADAEAPGAGISGVPQKHRIAITISPTHHDEAGLAQLAAQIGNRLAGLEAVSGTAVSFITDPPWTPLRITPAGRRILGLEGNRNLVQIR